MTIVSIFAYILTGFALAADASSVSIVYGTKFQPFKWRYALPPAIAFGVAQAVMPAIGWFGGDLIASYIEAVDHWVAFVILLIVGVNFIRESRHEVEVKTESFIKPLPLLMAALATSIDACAVGFSLSLSGNPILIPALIFGVVTFLCSMTCCRIGAKLGERFGSKLLCVGGIILIGIGTKILIEHLFFG